MKTFNLTLLVLLTLGMPLRLLAVWPPETMLQEEASKPTSINTDISSETTLPRPRALEDRLEEDERRLEKVLRDINEARQRIKEKHDGFLLR
jgi:hypothetical protein